MKRLWQRFLRRWANLMWNLTPKMYRPVVRINSPSLSLPTAILQAQVLVDPYMLRQFAGSKADMERMLGDQLLREITRELKKSRALRMFFEENAYEGTLAYRARLEVVLRS